MSHSSECLCTGAEHIHTQSLLLRMLFFNFWDASNDHLAGFLTSTSSTAMFLFKHAWVLQLRSLCQVRLLPHLVCTMPKYTGTVPETTFSSRRGTDSERNMLVFAPMKWTGLFGQACILVPGSECENTCETTFSSRFRHNMWDMPQHEKRCVRTTQMKWTLDPGVPRSCLRPVVWKLPERTADPGEYYFVNLYFK